MPSTQTSDPVATADGSALQHETDLLLRQESRYWYLLAAVCITTTAGLAFAVTPMLTAQVVQLWPWANTHLLLVVGLSLCTTLLVAYLTMRRRKASDLRRRIAGITADLMHREQQNAARLRALLNVSRMMGSLTSLEQLFDSITKTCVELFDCQQASLMLVNSNSRQLELRATTGHCREQQMRNATLRIGEGIAGWVARTQTPLILNSDTDPSLYPELNLKDRSISAAMVVPIVLRDELVGVVNVSSRQPGVRYNEEDLQALLVFAENAGTFIRHTEHVEWMRKSLHETMDQLAKLKAGEFSRIA
jgi:putative methionine-R-sulfoxide reductase with GAF domain